MKLAGLSRQIALSMMAMAFGVTLLVVLTSYAFYYLAMTYWSATSARRAGYRRGRSGCG